MSGGYSTDPPPCHPKTQLTCGWTPLKLTRYYDGQADVLTYHRLARDSSGTLRDEWAHLVYHPARGLDRVGSQEAPAMAWIDDHSADMARQLYVDANWRMSDEEWSLMAQPLIFEETTPCSPGSVSSES